MVKRLATSPHDPLGITDSACKNQLVMVSIQYGPFNTNIPIRSTTIGKSRVARDPITMHTSRRSNSDIECVTRWIKVDDVIGDVIQSQESAGSLLSRRKRKRRRRGSSRKLQCNQQKLLKIAIAKRCRLHKLIRQRFALCVVISALVTQLRLMCSYEVVDPSEGEEGEM
ncbi:hypothetical protein F511_28397 [Dorcoceras hygrometricum]|uniref:Uncharacterized protein n=1 Tax=Dorcoceras hygrometricum TaxID=472368 RepID=A0A2Z7A834_9LAMI|nr:hypothetical protein F511_28397 [Dorcoceras hygrometricum]